MPVSYSKINAVNNGVLICIDEQKDIYKYVPLEEVKIGNKTLNTVLKNKDIKIEELTQEVIKIKKRLNTLEELSIHLADNEGEEI